MGRSRGLDRPGDRVTRPRRQCERECERESGARRGWHRQCGWPQNPRRPTTGRVARGEGASDPLAAVQDRREQPSSRGRRCSGWAEQPWQCRAEQRGSAGGAAEAVLGGAAVTGSR
eukprot:SAG22_NODE_506_length_9643_cov_5.853206_14_plen_116_part_00